MTWTQYLGWSFALCASVCMLAWSIRFCFEQWAQYQMDWEDLS